MKTIKTALTALTVMAWVGTAVAIPTMFVSDGLGINSSTANASGTVILFSSDSVWSVVVLTGVASPPFPGPGALAAPVMSMTIQATSLGGPGASLHPLVITFASDGYGPTSSRFRAVLSGQTISGTGQAITFNTFYDPGNSVVANPTATALTISGSLTDYNGIWTSDDINVASPYSLTQVITIRASDTESASYSLGASLAPDTGPAVTCPPSAVVQCGASTELTGKVSDAEGEAMTVVWSLNGLAIQTNLVPASAPGTATDVSMSGDLPLGTNTVQMTVTDGAGNVSTCSTTVAVVDTTPPELTNLRVSPNVLWPPDHKMVPVTVQAAVSDACGSARWKIIALTSNQPVLGPGSGHTSPDWQITGDTTLLLRAERAGKEARTYTITVEAIDESGNVSAPQEVLVTVPK